MDPATTTTEPVVRLIPLGGLGEIGLNMMLVESGDDLIAVDCGLMFPDDELPGIDYVIPDFTYALAKGEGFRAVLLTHGHEDHIGAIPYLLRAVNVPVYGTPMTLALVAEKLREHGLLEGADLRPMRPRDRRSRWGRSAWSRFASPTRSWTASAWRSTRPWGPSSSPATSSSIRVRSTASRPTTGASPSSASRAWSCSARTPPTWTAPGHTRSEVDVGAALAERFAARAGPDHPRDVRLPHPPHPARPDPGRALRSAGGAARTLDGAERHDRRRARLPAHATRASCSRWRSWSSCRRTSR